MQNSKSSTFNNDHAALTQMEENPSSHDGHVGRRSRAHQSSAMETDDCVIANETNNTWYNRASKNPVIKSPSSTGTMAIKQRGAVAERVDQADCSCNETGTSMSLTDQGFAGIGFYSSTIDPNQGSNRRMQQNQLVFDRSDSSNGSNRAGARDKSLMQQSFRFGDEVLSLDEYLAEGIVDFEHSSAIGFDSLDDLTSNDMLQAAAANASTYNQMNGVHLNKTAMMSSSSTKIMNHQGSMDSPLSTTHSDISTPDTLNDQHNGTLSKRTNSHLASEQRRRQMMKSCFTRLEHLLPPSEYRRPSKANLLQAAVSYIEKMQRTEVAMRSRIQGLMADNQAYIQQLGISAVAAAKSNNSSSMVDGSDVMLGASSESLTDLSNLQQLDINPSSDQMIGIRPNGGAVMLTPHQRHLAPSSSGLNSMLLQQKSQSSSITGSRLRMQSYPSIAPAPHQPF